VLSDYLPDKSAGKYPPKFVENIDTNTSEVVKEKPIYVFEPKNIGEQMSIDDKANRLAIYFSQHLKK